MDQHNAGTTYSSASHLPFCSTFPVPQTEGDFDVVIPQDTMAGLYRVRVATFYDDTLFDCSQEFNVLGAVGWMPDYSVGFDDDDDDDDDVDEASMSMNFEDLSYDYTHDRSAEDHPLPN